MRRKEGFIDIDKMLVDSGNLLLETIYISNDYSLLKLDYENETYYYKYEKYLLPYNELIAYELACGFGFTAVDYDLAIIGNKKGVISKNFRKKGATYISGEELLRSCGYNDDDNNNLEDLWDALEIRYSNYPNKKEIVEKLMGKLVDLFEFDVITCQDDRHSANWEIEEYGDSVDIIVYDNFRMLSKNGRSSFVSLSVDRENNGLRSTIGKNLMLFKKISASNYTDVIRDKMKIIDEDNLKAIFKRIEDKIGYSMSEEVKKYYLIEFSKHRKQLNKVLDYKKLENGEHYERKNR